MDRSIAHASLHGMGYRGARTHLSWHVGLLRRIGRSDPNLKPGTVCVCGRNGLRKGMHATQHAPSPASRAGPTFLPMCKPFCGTFVT